MTIVNESNIGIIRAVYRLSYEEIGALMGVSGRFVSYVENGARNLPKVRANMLEKKLDLTPDKLTRLTEIYRDTLLPGK
ncbi:MULTISPECIES: helix-turn-helix domain-containing protein [Paenibacillus]|uniref:Transcriptional regulator n=2 Tax=Paenibacillus TaxID=44249 RepID=A0ABX2Z688_PAEPO|nr:MULTISPECIES: helix-turn-helix transcriptional regulator [Paenibacillus]MDR6779673.1 transcriptional regulator with XRE-family HTH domain [Paenibacillus peoriae]ODA06723.1 transcriptional regulator [Paenibacillus polymyxa]OME70885.1 transcriptional regulator [Paenibacillus peoriae]